MKRVLRLFSEFVSLVGILSMQPVLASATGTPPQIAAPSHLAIAEVKMTGDEFVVLQNNGDAPISDLSTYWLYSFNKVSPQLAGATSSAEQLPIASLGRGQSVVLGSGGATCGAEVTAKLSISLSDSTGVLQLIGSNSSTGLLNTTPTDSVSWGTDGDITSVPSSTRDRQAAYYRVQTSDPQIYDWQLADVHINQVTGLPYVCQLDVAGAGSVISSQDNSLLPPGAPPATIVSVDSVPDAGAGLGLPVRDVGLSSPQVNELLPNPAGTGNDDTDEFIEIYNPNTTDFDLSGFSLQTGTTTKHTYAFPGGTSLAAKSFGVFYAADTNLSLSNNGGQVVLLDPFGNAISQSDAYGAAKDGVTWALAKGTWYWTSQPTPGAANVIRATAVVSSSSKGSSSKSGSAVKGSSTANGSSNSVIGATDAVQVTPIHPWTLAVVALLAVAYGVYEYRLDLANRIYEFRRHHASRRSDRYTAKGR